MEVFELEQGLDLGSKGEATVLLPDVKRFYADVISAQQELAEIGVPKRDGKHPIEVDREIVTVLLVEMRDDLGVCVAAKTVSLGFELLSELAEVVDLAIEDRDDITVL